MKRYLKLALLSLLCALTFVVAGCDETKPSVPDNGGNNTQQPGGDTQGNTDNNNQGNTEQGGNNQEDSEPKPLLEQNYLYDIAKKYGYTGTDVEWNSKLDEINKSFEAHSNELVCDDFFYHVVEGKPTDSTDPNYSLYYDSIGHQYYVTRRENGNVKWILWEGKDESTPGNVMVKGYGYSYVLCSDYTIKLAVGIFLNNGKYIYDFRDINVTNISLSNSKVNLAMPSDLNNLSLVISSKINNMSIKGSVMLNAPIVINNEIKNEVGSYNVSVKLNNQTYTLVVNLINTQKSLFDAAKELGYQGSLSDWDNDVARLSTNSNYKFYDSNIKCSYGTTAPTDNIATEVNFYVDVINRKAYFRDKETNKWLDGNVQSNPDNITLVDIDYHCFLCDDGKVRSITLYVLSNGCALTELEDIDPYTAYLSTNEIHLSDPNFENSVHFIVKLTDGSTFNVPLNSSLVVENNIKPAIGEYTVCLLINGSYMLGLIKVLE